MQAVDRDSRQDAEEAKREAEEAETLFIDRLIKAGGAGWANDPSGAGSVLVERATGCVFLSFDGNPIRSAVRIKFPSADKVDKGKFRAHVDFFEGVVQYMYLDRKFNVTVGIGHFLLDAAEAEKLQFYRRQSKANPHPIHIKNAFDKVRRNKQKAKFGASAFKDLTHLDLDLADIESLFEADVERINKLLRASVYFSGFETYPAGAQLGMLDIAYTVGVDGFFNGYPEFKKALESRNWLGAADQSGREVNLDKNGDPGLMAERNKIVRGWFLDAIKDEPFFINPNCPPKLLPIKPV